MNSQLKTKIVYLGDPNSINIELITKSFYKLKGKVKYILVGNLLNLQNQINIMKANLSINEILNPYDLQNIDLDSLNIFNLYSKDKTNFENLINQIKICNEICSATKFDLVTMPIDKSVFKKKIKFNGMTEYLGALNKKETIMLMVGEKFSIIPITTHIELKNVCKKLNENLDIFFNKFNKINKESNIFKNYDNYIFLCINPHCGEGGTLGNDDQILIKNIKKIKNKNKNVISADSAFRSIKKNSLFFSLYHDQALIPFKILNKKSFNLTLGLPYRRMSPAHGTAKDIKYKNLSNELSYIECMLN